jgi:hypothetical protein
MGTTVGKGDSKKLREKLQKKFRCNEQVKKEYNQTAAVLGPLACAWASKIEQRNFCPVNNAVETTAKGKGVEPPQATILDKQFKLTGEPLYRGKGNAVSRLERYSTNVLLACLTKVRR